MTQPVIAKEYRGGHLENTHQGMICVINKNKEVIYGKGNNQAHVFYRSAMKPIQAIPAFLVEIIEKYDLSYEEVALLTASQRGETYHEEALLNLAEKLQIEEETLICGESYPLNEEPKERYLKANKPKRKLMHNCAGKHLGLIAYAREMNYGIKGYEDINHPVQQKILQFISNLSETSMENIRFGTDGCGVANHSIPLQNIAISFLKFADPRLIEDKSVSKAVTKIGEVMNAYPKIIASHDFICTTLLQDPNIIAKGGAQGVYCLSLRKEKISIALKVLSGTELIWPLLVANLLEKINYENKDTIARLHALGSHEILNDAGQVIGRRKVFL